MILASALYPGAAAWADERASAPDQGYLQCVPYARQLSGIQIYGDAHSWWKQAKGRYERGKTPMVGAVMALKPHGAMQLGHVAYVSKIVDSRHILLDHANWSLINGRRGQIERGVMALDVSENNDWSEVRVWYAPIQALGTTRYPLYGFIYPDGSNAAPMPGNDANLQWASADKPQRRKPASSRENPNIRQTSYTPAAEVAQGDPIGGLMEQLGM